MAGVMAMASVIEDFDTQPCKKSRKDGGSPVVKTITNYFSPVPKPMEKPFSPPRSSNITDYFTRKASSSKEKTSPPEPSKENCQKSHSAEKHTSPEVGKQPSQRKGRKTSRAARKLVAAETVVATNDVSCLLVEEPQESKESEANVVTNYGIFGSNTAALLSQLSAEARIIAAEITGTETVSDKCAESDELREDGSKCENSVRPETALNTTELLPNDQAKQVKVAAGKAGKRQQKEAKHPEPEEKEPECDVSMEISRDEASQLNSSTVTISFEDFLRSQNETEGDKNDVGKDEACKITAEMEELNSEQLDIPEAEENVVPSVQISPRTVTIHADVHVVSPKQKVAKADGKVASIFSRRKRANSPTEMGSSTNTDADHQSFSPLTGKRRSNVVLQEEDLELIVLDSESIPKCSEAEKRQFMAAFKQPSMDGSKIKSVKGQGKQKQEEEKILDVPDKTVEDDVVIQPSVEQISEGSKSATKKPTKKGRNKAKNKKDVATSSAAVAVEETVATITEDDDKREEPPITSTPSVPAVRRSRREAVVRQTLQTIPATPVRKTRRQNESKDAVTTASPQDSPIKISTPKTPKSRHGVFVAEIVCPPDAKESPIRIKFSRVHKNTSKSKAESGSDTAISSKTKTSNESKNRRQAKKLLEKAKVIQQSKKSPVEKENLRRSSRTKTSIRRSYCEDEDSVICVDDQTAAPQTALETSKTKKALRSLNDVLGKAAPASKDAKAAPGSKVAPLGQERSVRKASAVVSIFDESSHEGSEISQDGEQFRARREFLKSGLPESFKKQMAKTAANKEAYTLTCSSFQPVTHTTQPPTDCPLWNLPWPESLLLCHLKELGSQMLNPLPSISGFLDLKTVPSYRNFLDNVTGWRPEITESVRQLLMEEFGASNPHFPAQMFITRFLKRRTDHQQQFTALEPEATVKDNTSLSAGPVGGKRKRKDDEGENTVKVAKKQRSSRLEENLSLAEPEPPSRGGRTRRAQRSRLQKEEEVKEEAGTSLQSAPILIEDDSVVILDDLPLGKDARKKDVVKEDVLWTDKYQPQHSSDIIDNTASVKRLHSWLKEWKLRTDREERKKQKEKKQEEDSDDSDWDCGEEDSQDGVDMLCNTMLITGPTGIGKTAAVYACAQELGFKVFEVNASSQRSGRLILSQLKEATQSHQVDSQGVNAHKPTYFNSYGTSSSSGSVKTGSSPRKANSPRRVVSSPRKQPQSPRGAKRGGLAPISLANFFKISQPTNKEPPNSAKNEQTAASKKAIKALTAKSPVTSTFKKNSDEEQSKKTATSLILFEEVDVIFDDDSGFLSAIKTFMTTTKRPVILTTSDPSFSFMFDGNFEEIHFKTPSVVNVSSYLQLLCLAEDIRTNPSDIRSLLRLNGCDIRQSLLQLQFWTRSAGGQISTRPTSGNSEVKMESNEAPDKSSTVSSSLPLCETGCTEGKLGLLNIEPVKDIWELLRSQSLIKEAVCWDLLTDSRQRGVDLLYSNMENLLPLPLTQLTTSKLCKPETTCPQADTVLPSPSLLSTVESDDRSDSESPIKVSSRMKNKKQRQLPDRDGLHSESDSEDGFPSLCTLQRSSLAEKMVKKSVVSESLKRKPPSPEERVKSVPVSRCLESIADFLDDMSYVDSSLLLQPDRCNMHRRVSPISAVIKDGMTDELRVETDRRSWSTGERFFEIQAAVEALSFHKCRDSVAESWEKVQQLDGELGKEAAEELALPVAAHREGCSFTQDGPCQPQLVQKRRELMENLMFKGVFGTLGNRQTAALDYLPVVRTICRSEQLKEQGKVKRRFLHYLDAIHLGLEKSTLQLLAEDFP